MAQQEKLRQGKLLLSFHQILLSELLVLGQQSYRMEDHHLLLLLE